MGLDIARIGILAFFQTLPIFFVVVVVLALYLSLQSAEQGSRPGMPLKSTALLLLTEWCYSLTIRS